MESSGLSLLHHTRRFGKSHSIKSPVEFQGEFVMTVRKLYNALKDAKKIVLAYDGIIHPFDGTSVITMEAFGDYIVSEIRGGEKGVYELTLAMRPIREGEL